MHLKIIIHQVHFQGIKDESIFKVRIVWWYLYPYSNLNR